jgi:GAF domain-containing protein
MALETDLLMGSERTYRGTAEPGDGGRWLAEQQAAHGRVATLITEGATGSEVFTAVVEEAVALLDVAAGSLFRYEPDRSVSALASVNAPGFPVGSRWQLDGPSLSATIFEAGRPARIDESSQLGGTIAAVARESGHGSACGVPITVDGVVWGLICVYTAEREPLPADTEARLRDFAELVATAISKAQANDDLRRLVRQKEGLTRVATTVAEGVPAAELFAAVTQEVVHALEVPAVSLVRYEADRSTVVLSSLNAPDFPVGRRLPHDGRSLSGRVLDTGRPTRAGSELRSEVGVPIVVDGEVWGLILAAANGPEPLRTELEASLQDFTGLMATAISKTESGESLRRVVAEQAALRSVATLVAEGAAPADVLSSVAQEVARILDVSAVSVVRFESAWSVVVASFNDPGFPVGSRWPLEGPSLNATVSETGKPAQIDYSELPGPVATAARSAGVRVGVGVPIVVEGRVWGMMAVGQRQRRDALPAFAGSYSGRIVLSTASPQETQARLAAFTELVATAISNAQAHDDLRGLAMEQAALRRVATLVARDAPPGEVFDAVAMEVGKLLDTDITVVGRYDGDGAATAIGSWSASPGGVPVGTRSVLGGRNVLTLVAESAKPARVDGYDDSSGEAAEIARRHGWRSSIAAPIIVEGRLWGVMLVATKRPEPFPAGAEDRLAAFTDLVATALANAQAHDEVRRFGEEQAALGRVATLVAAGATPEQVFKSVVDEASSLLGLELVAFGRVESDDTATIIAASAKYPVAPGSRWSLKDPSVIATVARTKRAARIDDYGGLEGETARTARSQGFRSAIGAPLTVEGRLWGAIIAYSRDPEPIPEQSEVRLGQFTELVATAVANAEARQALERVAAEQATLRRIATLVARGVQAQELCAAVAEETAATFNAITALMRFEHDPPGVVLVGASGEAGLSIGTRWEFEEGMASAEVYRTGRSGRFSSSADYWASRDGPVAEAGRRLRIVSQVSCPIAVEGGVWGVITVNARDELPRDTEQRLEKFTDLVSTAIANAEGKSELAASRRRIVAAADEARRRIERDLHDGIQQRLIALTFRARAMTRKPPDELAGIAAELAEGLKDASDELREVSRGIHPTILTEAGLGAALRALARRSDVPIEVDVRLDERLPPPIEAAAYYIASEALTNVAKHAHANAVHLTATHDDGVLTVEVRDDGAGGVDAGRGSGILGLTDRAEALGGTISITSPPRGGTTLSVELPITTPAAP